MMTTPKKDFFNKLMFSILCHSRRMLIPFGAPAHLWLNISFVNAITDFIRLYSFDCTRFGSTSHDLFRLNSNKFVLKFVSRVVSRFGLQSFLLQAFTSLFHIHQILE